MFAGHTRTALARLYALVLLVLVLASARSVSAFPAELQVIAKVSIGKTPKLVFKMTEPALRAEVKLKREDGKTFNFALGNVTPGTIREIALDGRLGRHQYEGVMSAIVDGEEEESPLSFETVVAQPISIDVSRKDLDLENKRLELLTNRKVSMVELKIIDLAGRIAEESTKIIDSWTANKPIVLGWNHTDPDRVLHLDVRVEDRDGFFNAVRLTPWQVSIPHEEVLFATGSARIRASEVSKLEDSLEQTEEALQRYSQIRGVQLFIAGHTDTQGSALYNLNLSRKRARAIASWFVNQGLDIPTSYEGFGESSLKVNTADEVDEERNRRVDYILSIQPPTLTRGSWKRIR